MRRVTDVVAALGLIASGGLILSTLLPGAPFLPSWIVFLFFPAALAVHWRSAVVSSRLRRRGLSVARLARRLPSWPVAGLLCCFGLTVVTFVMLFVEVRGEPKIVDGRYVLSNHGEYIPVSRDEYLHAVSLSERAFGSLFVVFFAVAVLVGRALPNERLRGPRPRQAPMR
jgi:hypothetical protein